MSKLAAMKELRTVSYLGTRKDHTMAESRG